MRPWIMKAITTATTIPFLAAWLLVGLVSTGQAAKPYVLELDEAQRAGELELAVGKSQIIRSPVVLEQVVVGNPKVADVKLLSAQQVLVLGKSPGHTNLAFRGKDEALVALMDLVIGYDIVAIRRKLNEVLPREENLEVRSANDSVMLSGEISSTSAMDTALAVARSFAPDDKVLNMMRVGGGQQVMLQARIAEVSRTSLKRLGFETEITGTSGQDFSFDVITGAPVSEEFGGLSLTDTGVFDFLNLRLSALERQGLANILAEPNIVALSGQEANFLAGGEFPVPVAQTGATTTGTAPITVEFKEFGVALNFTPTVLDEDKISLKLRTEVSSIDRATGTRIAGVEVPGISTRRAGTTIEMADGQSFAIAGLLQNDINNAVRQLPGLGKLPILGPLFRSTDFQREETELVILMTPRLVEATASGRHALPTDDFVPPSDVDQYLRGQLEGPSPGESAARKGNGQPPGIEGEFGHQL